MAIYTQGKMPFKRVKNDFNKCYVFVLTLLEVLGKTHMSVHDNNHAFLQANSNDVRFMGVHEGLQVFMHKDVESSSIGMSQVHEDISSNSILSSSSYLKFVPPHLDFKERHLGVPHLEKVTLVNTDDNKTIHMSSVSGNTLHFHSSFFQDKTIPPKGNTTFAVVFLGRTEGHVSSSLFIHTSEGTFKYQVSGASVCSPYRLRPLGGIRLPLNAAFQPLIQLHNPHHYPIQVVEVYSSGSEFHLELPGGEMEGPKTLWEVPPYATKPVIRAKFQANSQSNHTAYIRLKLNNSEEVLVVPLEIEVTSQPGLYSQQHSIDFGIGGSQDQPSKVKLYLCNSLKKTQRIQSVTAVPATPALQINFDSVKIPPGTSPVEVAELIFDWKTAFETKQTFGKILIKSKQNQYKLGIPFTARVLEGGLRVNEGATKFLTADRKFFPRQLTVENQFKVPIAINNVSLLDDAINYFLIKHFKLTVIPPQKSVNLLTIYPKENFLKDVNLVSSMILYTNISDITVSLLIYNGKLTKIFPRGYDNSELLDVGLVGCGSTKTLRFGLQNNNPVDIEIKSVKSNSQFLLPKILGIFSENVSEFLSQHNFANLKNSTNLKPNEIVVIELVIYASKNEEIMTAQVTIFSQYDNLTIPVKVSAAHGALEVIPNQILLDDCFPGKICTQPLKIQSTFNRPMTATSITSIPPDSRMSFSGAPGGSEILPSSSNYIGDLKWEPEKNCGNHCYLGISLNSSESSLQWMQSDELLSPYISDMDANLLRDRYHRLLNLTNGFGSGHWQDIFLRLDTNEVREELFMAKVKLIWPKFSNTSKLVFPLTQVTNTTVQRLKLFNSASHMIVVQLVTEWAYPQAKRLLDSFPPNFISDLGGNCYNSTPKEFYLTHDLLESSEPHGKLNTTLAPGETFEVTIAYTPRIAQKSCSLLFIRNNLTVVEVIELHGKASYAQLKFGNRKPGSSNPLTFEIGEKHLKDCQREKNKKLSNLNLTVKKSFTVRNVGELPVFVHNFYINGLECEGYGFSVLNCASFELPVNETKRIDVAFTPDFTLTKIQRTLTIDTSLGIDVNYTLKTTLPPLFLSTCSSVLMRPAWEPLLYYSAVSFMVFLLFCVLAAAFFESDRILKCALMTLAREKTAIPLDLRQIGTNVLKEFHQNSSKKTNNYEHVEKGKQKDGGNLPANCSSVSAADDRQPCNVQKEDNKTEIRVKSEESVAIGKDRDNSSLTSITQIVQLNNLTKHKKKFNKKSSSNSESTEQTHDTATCKKKDKHFSNSGWCSVFSRANTDKMKSKSVSVENENVKQVRNDVDFKKDEHKKEEKKFHKIKKVVNKEPSKEEEETSSTTTDSSNDAEKENSDVLTRVKNDRIKKAVHKERKASVLECKENNCDGNSNDEEFDKEKKNVGKNAWKMNSKSNKFNNGSNNNMSIWKLNNVEGQKNLDVSKVKVTKSMRDRKEKNGNKRRFEEKVSSPKTVEPLAPHRSSPCWEHRTFSEVVARNDSPQLYSNIVSARSSQPKPHIQSESVESEVPKTCDTTISSLGPIGSKKPLSHWSPISYDSSANQTNVFNANFPESSSAYMHSSETDFTEDTSHSLEDLLPIDPENLWEDQHAAMQLMHQQDTDYELSWKAENWLDELWCANQNVQPSETPHDNFNDQSWGSYLHTSWGSPTPWSSNTDQCIHPSMQSNISHHISNYNSLADHDNLISLELQNPNVNIGNAIGQETGIMSLHSFNRTPAPSLTGESMIQNRSRENLVVNGIQFDPFHSLSSIWSPKTQNSWNTPGNQ